MRATEALTKLSKLGAETIRLYKHPGLESAVGTIAGRSFVPSLLADSANFDADLSTVQNKIFIDALQTMRDLSKTGGAVGNVSDKEGDRLANSMRSLTQVQSPKNMRRNLALLARDFNESMDRIAGAYFEQYGQRLPVQKISVPDIPGDEKQTAPKWSWGP